MARLHEHYEKTIKPEMIKQFGFDNPMRVPRLEKIIINMGVGEASQDKKLIEGAVDDMTRISGQKPVITKAKKSIAAFKLRDGMMVGCKVTLRRARMYEFLDRLINIALPRVRDFRGVSDKSFDGCGNFALGLKEQIIFPEIDYDKVTKIRGMNIVICTTASNDDEARELLRGFDMPFGVESKSDEPKDEKPESDESESDEPENIEPDSDEPENGEEQNG